MVGGAYVWGGSQFGATDCSGLVMLSFAQVGINLPHYAASQALYGTTVSYNNMKKGDVIFFGGASISSIYHVAIYIGDGKWYTPRTLPLVSLFQMLSIFQDTTTLL